MLKNWIAFEPRLRILDLFAKSIADIKFLMQNYKESGRRIKFKTQKSFGKFSTVPIKKIKEIFSETTFGKALSWLVYFLSNITTVSGQFSLVQRKLLLDKHR